jgi:hypothetical protein
MGFGLGGCLTDAAAKNISAQVNIIVPLYRCVREARTIWTAAKDSRAIAVPRSLAIAERIEILQPKPVKEL